MEKLSVKIESKYENVASVCDKAKAFCLEAGLSELESINVEICLDEALNNVVKHSYKEEPENIIIIEFTREAERIRIDIVDFGESRKETVKKNLNFDPNDIESLPEGGMGLFIIEKIMDGTEYKIESDRNIFTLYKNLSG